MPPQINQDKTKRYVDELRVMASQMDKLVERIVALKQQQDDNKVDFSIIDYSLTYGDAFSKNDIDDFLRFTETFYRDASFAYLRIAP